MWRVRGRVPASNRLLELLKASLGVLQPSERDGLVALVLGEPLGVPVFAAISGEADVAAYETRHLVRVESDRRRLQVRLAHPLYGDLLRARLSPLTSRTICRRLAEATESLGARRREDVLRVATWQLEGGGPLRGDLLLAAAQQARARGDLPLAENLALRPRRSTH